MNFSVVPDNDMRSRSMKTDLSWSTCRRGALSLIVCATAWASAAVPAQAAGSIPWRTNLQTASNAAVSANKPLLIEFWAAWCPPCKVMDAEVYTDAGVITGMAKVLPVRIDVDKQDSLARKYDVASMPTLIFADSYGNELFRFFGTINVATMIQLLEELPGDVRNINRLAQIIARDKDNFAALESLGRELKTAGLFRSSNVYYGRATRVRTAPKDARTRGEILVAMGHNHLELKEFREAADMFGRYLEDFNGGPAEPEAMLGLGRALLFQNKRADAKRALQTLTSRYKTGPIYNEAVSLLASL
jgi:thiol-disulfide isomerase/thioredoxin